LVLTDSREARKTGDLMPRNGLSNWREWLPPIAWLLVITAVPGVLAAAEALRIATARATVPGGWAAGIAAGAGVSLALVALLVAAELARRRRLSSGRPEVFLVIAIVLLLAVAFCASTPAQDRWDGRMPAVVTSDVEVAAIAYLGMCLAQLAVLQPVLIVRAVVRKARQRTRNCHARLRRRGPRRRWRRCRTGPCPATSPAS
jgi:hypothetical protein